MQNACRPPARGDRATGFIRRASGFRGLRDSSLPARRWASEPVGALLGPPPPPVQTATSYRGGLAGSGERHTQQQIDQRRQDVVQTSRRQQTVVQSRCQITKGAIRNQVRRAALQE